MGEAVTRAEYARRAEVTRGAVKMWISRGKLTAPALRPDGLIDVELADAQLRATIDLSRHIGQGGTGAFATNSGEPALSRAPTALPEDVSIARQLQKARAVSAVIDAERKRRELNAERGRYMLTEGAQAAWARELAGFLEAVEQGFPELATAASLDRHQLIAVRTWWREKRQRLADRYAAEAAAAPEFVSDSELV